MSDAIDIEAVKAKAREIVFKADADGLLQDLTPRIVRQKIEEELSLESGALDEKDNKAAVKIALTAALDELEERPKESEKLPPGNASPEAETKNAGKRKSPDLNDVEEAPTKKPKTTRKKAETQKQKLQSSAKAEPKDKAKAVPRASAKKSKAVRSPSIVTSSDEDEASEKPSEKTKVRSPKTSPTKTDKRPKKPRQKPVVESDEEIEQEPPSPSTVKTVAITNGESSISAQPAQDADEKSESEMSVLIDERPKPRKRKSKDEDSKASKPKRKSKLKAEDLSPNEEEIKRLKSFVTACGIRKMWSKELKDMDEREQIQHLKHILAELGMTGRLSMEKAKAIRTKRELAKELEDVQEFEKAILNKPAPSRRSRSKVEYAESEEDEPEEEVKPRKRISARASINAFLGDQSDD